MHRLTARLLLLLALAGNLFPLAMAAVAAPAHACCIRKAHQCHDSLSSDKGRPSVRDANCCDHSCCRAAATAQWGHPANPAAYFGGHSVEQFVRDIHPLLPRARAANFYSSRGPPRYRIV